MIRKGASRRSHAKRQITRVHSTSTSVRQNTTRRISLLAQNSAALIERGMRHFARGEFRSAADCYERAVAAAHANGTLEEELTALDALAVTLGSLGDPPRSGEAAMRLLARAQQSGRNDFEMIATLRLTDALADMDLRGYWHQIQPLLLRSLGTAQWMRERFYEVYCLLKLGEYAIRVGEMGYARLHEGLKTIVPGMESEHWFRGETYSALSRYMRLQENYAEAARYAAMALGQAQLRGRPDMIAEMQLVLAEAEDARGDRKEALHLVEQARAAANKHHWQGIQQQAEYLYGTLRLRLGHAGQAEAAIRRALELARTRGAKQEEVDCLLALGQVQRELRYVEEARETLEVARQLSQERNYSQPLALAEKLLAD
jgi:tetratricopeptide (TPR) repeat protein